MRAVSEAPRSDVRFDSGEGLTCAGWLYRPDGGGGDAAPLVILAHGFGALKEGRLDAYAERFRAAGFAALVFDYRYFGESEGEPRQLLNVGRQLEDWAAAVAYAHELDGIDPDRIALWGSSFSGGHVIETASRDRRIAAAIAQSPLVSGMASLRENSVAGMLRMTVAGLRDGTRAALGRDPYYAPIVSRPGTLGAMTSPDALPGYTAMYPDGFDWRNEVAGRIFLTVALYAPGRHAARVACPLLVQACQRDVVTPPGPADDAARAAPRGELVRYPIGHFDIYLGEAFERSVSDQLDFLRRHLG